MKKKLIIVVLWMAGFLTASGQAVKFSKKSYKAGEIIALTGKQLDPDNKKIIILTDIGDDEQIDAQAEK